MDGRDKQEMRIFEKTEDFDTRPKKSARINGKVRKTLLESGGEVGHIRCPKPDSPVYKTGYSSFDRTKVLDT
jgi:hypothetical protein